MNSFKGYQIKYTGGVWRNRLKQTKATPLLRYFSCFFSVTVTVSDFQLKLLLFLFFLVSVSVTVIYFSYYYRYYFFSFSYSYFTMSKHAYVLLVHLYNTSQQSALISNRSLNHLYADDTQIFISFTRKTFTTAITQLQNTISDISSWMTVDLLSTHLKQNLCSLVFLNNIKSPTLLCPFLQITL